MAVSPSCDAVYRCGECKLKEETGPNRTRAAGQTRIPRIRELRLLATERRCGRGAARGLQATERRCGVGGKRRRGERAGRTGSGDWPARMAAAAAAAMTATACGGAGAARSLSRFRGCLAGALLGDCVGAIYEAHDTVSLTSVLRHVQSLEPDLGSPGSARTGGRDRVHVGTREGRAPRR